MKKFTGKQHKMARKGRWQFVTKLPTNFVSRNLLIDSIDNSTFTSQTSTDYYFPCTIPPPLISFRNGFFILATEIFCRHRRFFFSQCDQISFCSFHILLLLFYVLYCWKIKILELDQILNMQYSAFFFSRYIEASSINLNGV